MVPLLLRVLCQSDEVDPKTQAWLATAIPAVQLSAHSKKLILDWDP